MNGRTQAPAAPAPDGGAALLDPAGLIADARRLTGLTDFGEPDPRESLDALARALVSEAALTAEGAAGKRAGLVRVLANRLLLHDAFARNPAIAEERIRSPIVIVGLPRSGTTKLQRMIAADPVMQKLPLWRLLHPVRALAPLTAGASDVAARVAAAEQFVEGMRTRTPEAYAAHPMLAGEPDEEYFAMELSFLSHLNTSSFHAPSYEAWLARQSFAPWYAWLRRLLQYVQHVDGGAGRPWVLKAPHHMGYLPLLFEYFPDATVVHCHRDPVQTIPSFCALIRAARRGTSVRDDPAEAARYVMRIYGPRMRQYLADRERLEGRHAFVDVSYLDIVRDSAPVIARCYAAAGLDLPPASLAAMRAWEVANEQHKHGQHRYALEDFGLTRDGVAAEFTAYTRRFAPCLA